MEQFIWLVLTIIDPRPRYAIIYFIVAFPNAYIDGLKAIESNTVQKWLCCSKPVKEKNEKELEDLEEPPVSKKSTELAIKDVKVEVL